MQLREAGPQRHIEVFEDDASQMVRAVAFRRKDGGDGARILLRALAHDLDAPGADGGTSGFRVPSVTAEHVWQPFFVQHLNRFAQTVKQIRRRRIGEESRLVLFQDLLPVPVRARHPGTLVAT